MAIERTLSIIKPDVTERNLTGQIIARLEAAGLRVIAQKRIWWKKKDARKFYEVHKGQDYFKTLVAFMTSGPIVVQVLEGENAIDRHREVMGATDPGKAAKGTIRADFATSIEENVCHGSDAPETAVAEIAFFFSQTDICPRTR